MGRRFDRGLVVGVAILGTVMVCNAVLSDHNTRRLADSHQLFARNCEVLNTLADLRAATERLEADQRTYLFTGDDNDLAEFQGSILGLRDTVEHLRSLTSEEPPRQERISLLESDIDKAAILLAEATRVRGEGGVDMALLLVFNGQGQAALNQILSRVDEMGRDERALLEQRRAAGDRAYTTALAGGLISGGLGVLGLLGFAALFARHLRAKAAAGRHAELLRTTLESIGDGVISTDAAGRVTSVNSVAAELTGWCPAHARGRPIDEVFRLANELSGEPAENPASRAMRLGEVIGPGDDTVLRSRDGSERPVEARGVPIRDEGGQVAGSVLVFRDVTERRLHERELALQAERFRSLVVASAQIVWTTSPDGLIVDDSPTWRRFTGQKIEEFLGRGWLDVVHPDDRELASRAWAEAVAEKSLYEVEYRLRTASGDYRWMVARGVPILGEDGRIREWVGLNSDIHDRRMTDEALRDTLQRYRLVSRAANDAIWDWDLLTGQVTWNEGVVTLFGHAEDAVRSHVDWWIEAIHPEDRERVHAGLTDVIDHGREKWADEYRFRRGDGSYTPVYDRGFVLYDTDGRASRMIGSMMDQSERRQAEQRLRDSERNFRELAESMPQIVWVAEPDGRHEYFNRKWYEFTGGSSDEWEKRLHPDDRDETMRRWERSLAAGEPFQSEHRFRSREGTYHWFLGRALPVRDDAGRVMKWFGTCTEIDEQKRIADALRESEERFRVMADNIPQLAWMARSDGWIFWYNRRWYDYTGTTLEQMQGWGWESVHDPKELPGVVESFRESLRTGEPWEHTFPIRRHDGVFRWHLTRMLPVRDEQGRVVRWFGTNTDITDRLEMEERLRQTDRRKDDFLAVLSHELRNPLAPIRNGLGLIRLARDDRATIDETLGVMERQLGHMVHLLDDLLDLSRITRGKIKLRRRRLDLADVIRSALEVGRPAAEESGNLLNVEAPPGSVYLDGDLTRLAQVVANLLTNAAKYTPEGGRIDLRYGRDGDDAVISVKDSGIGILPEMLPRIFEPFWHVDKSLERRQGGLGIGLTIVRRLIEMHGGRVEVFSDGPGTGTEFVVRLPAAKSPPTERDAPSRDEPISWGTTPKKVLVVDDNRDSATTLGTVLELKGYQVRTAHDGVEAVERAEEFRPDIILMDIGMPRMNGLDATRQIRAQSWGRRMTIIAVTGWGQKEDKRRTREAGCDGHLVKPLDPEVLGRLLSESGPPPEN